MQPIIVHGLYQPNGIHKHIMSDYTSENKPVKQTAKSSRDEQVSKNTRDDSRDDMELTHQTRLLELLMKISATYISIPESQVDQAIHKSLAELGDFVGADRFYIFEYDFGRNVSNNTHEWCADGIEPQIRYLQNYANEHIPQWVTTHRKGGIMHVPNVQALSHNDSIRQMLEPQGIKSLIAVPMMDGDDCVGFVGLDFVSGHHSVTEYEKKLLTIFAQMMVNVQNRIRMQKSLKENERFLADLIDMNASIIAVKNRDGTYQLVNQKWQDVTGISKKEALGKTDRELFNAQSASSFMNNDRHVLATGETIESEEVLCDEKGERRFLSKKFPVRDVHGSITSLCAVIFEITDRKKAEEHRIARSEAEAANKAKSTFLSHMSHEIRTPLNAIMGFSHILENDGTLSGKQAEQVQTIARSSRHLHELVSDVLDFSRIEAGAATVNPVRFSPHHLVENVSNMYALKAADKGLQISVEISGDLPRFVSADEAKLRQILVNLTSNAVNVTDKGGITLRARYLKTNSSSERAHLRFEVEDTGPGIAPENQSLLFDRFVQLKEGIKAGGTGLGLSISKELAELMGGTIDVDSIPGNGSCFGATVPIRIVFETEQPDAAINADAYAVINPNANASGNAAINTVANASINADTKADAAGRDASEKLTRASVSAIPEPVFLEIRTAIETGDMAALRKLADQMEPGHETTGKGIRKLADGYDYDTLIQLFSDEEVS